MNFLGMGTMELLLVALIGFIFLGPERIVGAARFLGKAVRQVRQATTSLPELIMDEDEAKPAGAPRVAPASESPGNPRTNPQTPQPPQAGETLFGGAGPVAFRPERVDPSEREGEAPPKQGQS